MFFCFGAHALKSQKDGGAWPVNIRVEHANRFTEFGEGHSEVHGDGRFADPAFGRANGEDSSDLTIALITFGTAGLMGLYRAFTACGLFKLRCSFMGCENDRGRLHAVQLGEAIFGRFANRLKTISENGINREYGAKRPAAKY